MQLLVGTTNLNKQKEIAVIFSHSSIELVFPQSLDSVRHLEVAETGSTFEENALLKAKAFALQSKLPSIADDSGLEVDALENFPGVLSARWFAGTSVERVQALLDKMAGQKNRNARFVTVVCLYIPKVNEWTFFRGEITGSLAQKQLGDDGFEYDRIFIPDGYTETFAQLGRTVKNKFSHRALACQKAKEYIEAHL